ncbi:transcription factor bHLH18-like isoform X2 [Abrus precatorius]|uniref:Transcription factor bHLH18-like isoform X2 n=1 Tax=Abrus precatorius TaxID=3816 RepID=A0A8B8KLJ2_ABRPR|nr:transcription factor bHLH18-like isoform X2 [Abrus precatorius]
MIQRLTLKLHEKREMDYEDNCFFHESHGDEFLRDILQQTPSAFSSESESDHSFHAVQNNSIPNVAVAASDGAALSQTQRHGNLIKSNSSNSSDGSNSKRPRRFSSPKTYILSFDNSTMVPATPEPCLNYDQLLGGDGVGSLRPSKRAHESQSPEPKARPNQGAKRARSSSQTFDHIMAERRRRQELTERFIALSATIPGLNKTDKASVLRAAIDYVKQLQERVQELENQDKKGGVVESVILMKKHDLNGNEDTTSSDTTSDNCSILPEMEARVLGNEVLIEIHCEKENGIELKILDHLENLHLIVTGSSVLPFGNSALCITIIAQMGDEYKMTVDELVKNLRKVLLKSHVLCDSDPY